MMELLSALVLVHFLCLPKENEPKERPLFQRHFLTYSVKNQLTWPKFSTGFREFLTAMTTYAVEKELALHRPGAAHHLVTKPTTQRDIY